MSLLDGLHITRSTENLREQLTLTPDSTSVASALMRAAERTEPAEARVWGDLQESEIARHLRQWLLDYAAANGGTFTAADAGRRLDQMGLPRTGPAAMNLRKRLTASVILAGKRDGTWTHAGLAISPRHGGPRTVWKVAA